MSSGEHAIAATWSQQVRFSQLVGHGVMVFPDGTVSPDIAVDSEARGVLGTDTVVWLPDPRNEAPFEITLARTDGQFLRTMVHPLARVRTATFDGTRYQLFWSSLGGVFHQSMSEDGALGEVHMLKDVPIDAIEPASDGAGTTLVRIAANVYFLDAASGALTQVATDADTSEQAFFFAGQFHLHEETRLVSITPGGVVTRRLLVDQLATTTEFYATANKLIAQTPQAVYEVSPDLVVTGQLPAPNFTTDIALLGTEYIQLRRYEKDYVTAAPGHVDVISAAWSVQLAIDSPLRDFACDAP